MKEQFPKDNDVSYDAMADQLEKYVINRLRTSTTEDDWYFHIMLREVVFAADKMREKGKRK